MEAMRQMKLETLKTRVGNADYEVDADAVAEAIVRRALATRRELRQAAMTLERSDPGSLGPALETG
jgi:hypothetical protein